MSGFVENSARSLVPTRLQESPKVSANLAMILEWWTLWWARAGTERPWPPGETSSRQRAGTGSAAPQAGANESFHFEVIADWRPLHAYRRRASKPCRPDRVSQRRCSLSPAEHLERSWSQGSKSFRKEPYGYRAHTLVS